MVECRNLHAQYIPPTLYTEKQLRQTIVPQYKFHPQQNYKNNEKRIKKLKITLVNLGQYCANRLSGSNPGRPPKWATKKFVTPPQPVACFC